MKLTPPKTVTFVIGLVLGILGFLAQYAGFNLLPVEPFLLVFIGWLVLVLGLMVRGI